MYTYHEAIIDPKMDLRTKDRRLDPIDRIDQWFISRINYPEEIFLPPQTHLPNSLRS